MTTRPWTVSGDGVVLAVRLTPKGGRDAIDGIDVQADGRVVLKARVRAVPADGEANAALVVLLAKTLGVRRSDVRLIAGETARNKRVSISGDPATLTNLLERLTT